jgi:hypothetical protein
MGGSLDLKKKPKQRSKNWVRKTPSYTLACESVIRKKVTMKPLPPPGPYSKVMPPSASEIRSACTATWREAVR